MDLLDHLSRILDILKDSTPQELGESVQTMLEGTIEPIVSPEERRTAVSKLIQTHEHTLAKLSDALLDLESEQSLLTNEILLDPDAKSRVQPLLRQVSRLAQTRSDSIKQLSQRSTILSAVLREAQANHPDQVLPIAVQMLGAAAPNWAKKYKGISKRINKLQISFAFKLGFEEIEQREKRQSNLKRIEGLEIDPYPHKFERTHTVTQIASLFEGRTGSESEADQSPVRVAGRIQHINTMGKASFIRITDGTRRLQIHIKSSEVDNQTWSLFKLLDLGDLIGTEGPLFRTKTGELSIEAKSITFLAKALIPPPDKYYGLNDIEIRYRQRYADLIANPEVRRVFEKRSEIIRRIRGFFDERGYIEVETPMLTPLPTGASARPFETWHNALGISLYARIAPELYLKRLIVGGFEKVYEINRNFRNEGTDRSHNPEFTMLEWYQAYSEYEDLLKLTEELISSLVEKVCGTPVIEYGENKIDFARPWKRLTMREAIVHYWSTGDTSKELRELQDRAGTPEGYEIFKQRLEERDPLEGKRPTMEELSTIPGLLALAAKVPGLKSDMPRLQRLDYGHLLGEIFEHVAEDKLINPTFITEFPTELSPLSKQNQDDPRFVDRFELFIAGMEIANAFCEINDPVDQRQRFEAQMKLRERGDDEAMVIDEDYIRALSYGMPPTAGEGVGIDRLVMILTNQHSIRDVILFPHMRPESK